LTHQLAPGTPKAQDVRTGPDNSQMTRKTSRIEIRADEEFIETIAKIAHQTRKSRAEVIREALNLYSMVINERLEHKRGIVFKDLEPVSEAE
jgi:hypothetical protein